MYFISQLRTLTFVRTENAASVKYRTEKVRKMSGMPNELNPILIKIKGSGNTFHIIPEGIYTRCFQPKVNVCDKQSQDRINF